MGRQLHAIGCGPAKTEENCATCLREKGEVDVEKRGRRVVAWQADGGRGAQILRTYLFIDLQLDGMTSFFFSWLAFDFLYNLYNWIRCFPVTFIVLVGCVVVVCIFHPAAAVAPFQWSYPAENLRRRIWQLANDGSSIAIEVVSQWSAREIDGRFWQHQINSR